MKTTKAFVLTAGTIFAISMTSCSHKPTTGYLETSAIEGPFDPLNPCYSVARVVKGEKDTLRRTDNAVLDSLGYGPYTFANAEIDDYENLLLKADISKDGKYLGRIECDYDGIRQLTFITMTSPLLKLDNTLTWDDESSNLVNIKQKRTIYDDKGNIAHEFQENVSFVYSRYSAFSNWSSGLARYMVGNELQGLFFDGVLGRASWTLPTEIEYTGVEIENNHVKEQYDKRHEIAYLKDCHGLIVEEHFFDPHEKENDFVYTYTKQEE